MSKCPFCHKELTEKEYNKYLKQIIKRIGSAINKATNITIEKMKKEIEEERPNGL